MSKMIDFKTIIDRLPPPLRDDFSEQIKDVKEEHLDAIIVLDDDPTGTQTVYDVPVLTSWDADSIVRELNIGTKIFYILTNSRSLTEPDAVKLGISIGRNIREASERTQKRPLIISRSDSTLRGHYPAEVLALEQGMKLEESIHVLIPAFFEGGRYTIDDVHYVKEGEHLVPAADTPFADDKVFGYQNSNLIDWVVEKTKGSVSSNAVKSISLEMIRSADSAALFDFISALEPGDVCVVNAADYNDLSKVGYCLLKTDKPVLLRSAASIVRALDAKPKKALLTAEDLGVSGKKGGLVVVGSYVPKTTEQVSHLRANAPLEAIEVDVSLLLASNQLNSQSLARRIDDLIQNGRSVLLYTSRTLVSANTPEENLAIGSRVSTFLTDTVQHLSVRPDFLIAKGGITSSDLATKSLQINRAIVQGQILPGVPVWKTGEDSKFANLPYVIFPGNVGENDALTVAFKKLVAEF